MADDTRFIPRTDWSRIQGRDFDYFAQSYWKPVHRFLRSRLRSADAAEEATQEAFLAFMQRDLLGKADPQRGSFRSFLFHASRQFLIDLYRRRSAMKRGADRTIPLESAREASAVIDTAPEAFDREWYLSLFNEARRKVKAYYEERDRSDAYFAFRLFHFGSKEQDRWSQKEIAEELDLTPSDVKNFVHRAKKIFARELRAAIASYVRNEDELEHEFNALGRFLEKKRLHGIGSTSFLPPDAMDDEIEEESGDETGDEIGDDG